MKHYFLLLTIFVLCLSPFSVKANETLSASEAILLPFSTSLPASSQQTGYYYHFTVPETQSHIFSSISNAKISLYDISGTTIPIIKNSATKLEAGRYYLHLDTSSSTSDTTTLSISYPDYEDIIVPVKRIGLKKSSITLYKGKTKKLKTTIYPKNATNTSLIYTSSKPSIVSVSKKGKIKAKKSGKATITIKSSSSPSIIKRCKIKVKEPKEKNSSKQEKIVPATATPSPRQEKSNTVSTRRSDIPVKKIILSHSSMILFKGKSAKISASVLPSNATGKALSYKIIHKKIATVKNGIITGKNPGITTLIVSAKKPSSCTATCTIIVR